MCHDFLASAFANIREIAGPLTVFIVCGSKYLIAEN